MKKLLSIITLLFLCSNMSAQTPTVAIQYYVDANNNCTYDTGEQLLNNVPSTLVYAQNSTTNTASATNTSSFTSCNGFTLYLWNAAATPANTLVINGSGISPNTVCGGFTNISYNTNSLIYLPVIVSGTSNIGVQVYTWLDTSYANSYNGGNLALGGGTVGLCSNYSDSVTFNMQIHNTFDCTGSNTVSPRTYTVYFNNVIHDIITLTGGSFSSSFAQGTNNKASIYEFYQPNQTYASLHLKLPTTFSVLGVHVVKVKSSMIYNDPLSVVEFSMALNSIPCSKISGKFFSDCNSNCVFDGNDSYGVGSFATGLIYNTATNYSLTFYPNWSGDFSVYLPATGSYSLTQFPTSNVSSTLSFTACSNATIAIPPATSTNTFLFGYKHNAVNVVDPSVYLSRISSSSPSVNPATGAVLGVHLGNNWWNVCASSANNPGTIKVTLPKFINYVNTISGLVPTVVNGATADTLIYTVTNFSVINSSWFNPASTFSIAVTPTAVPGTTFTIKVQIFPANDNNLANNTYNFIRIVGGPYDPNGKYVQAVGKQNNGDVPLGTQQFTYTIGFQNIGNAPAINVKTLDTIDVNFDLRSLEVLQSSFPVSTQINYGSREVAFHFDKIYLPGALDDEPGSHGFVTYSIKLKPGVAVNTVLKNRAHNYFDFLDPIATNQTSNKLVVPVSVVEHGNRSGFVRAMPNPFKSELQLVSDLEMAKVTVYSVTGQLIQSFAPAGKTQVLNLENCVPGIYLINISTLDGSSSVMKVIKE